MYSFDSFFQVNGRSCRFFVQLNYEISGLREALEFNRDDALAAAQEGYQEEAIVL